MSTVSTATCTPPTCTPPPSSSSSWGVSAFRLAEHPPSPDVTTAATAMSVQQEVPHPFPTVDVPDHAHYTIGSVILAIGITGVVGNLLVIYAFSRSRSLRTPPNMFIINLAVTDLLMCVTQAPVFFTTSMYRRWIFGEKACELYAFCGALFGITSMVTLMVIAVDRFLVITRPLASIGLLSRRRAGVVLGGAWAYALGWSLPPFFGWSAYIPEGLLTSCSWDYMTFTPSVRAYTLLLFIFVFFIPLAVIIYCYANIFTAIRSTNQAVAGVVSSRESVKTFHRLQNEWKMAKIALIVILLYVVSWSPYSAVALTAFAGYADMLTPYMNSVPAVIAKASAIHNPIIYAITHPKYRIALAKYIPYLGVLLCVHPRDLRSAGSSFVSTRRSTVSSQTSDVSARYRRSSAGGKARLSSASDSESGWTDTEADLSSTGSRPASRQVSCDIGGSDTAETTTDFKISSSSSNSFKASDWLRNHHDSGIFDSDVPLAGGVALGGGALGGGAPAATNGDIIADGHARRATIGRIPSIVVTAEAGGRSRSSSRSKPTNSTVAGARPIVDGPAHWGPSPPSE